MSVKRMKIYFVCLLASLVSITACSNSTQDSAAHKKSHNELSQSKKHDTVTIQLDFMSGEKKSRVYLCRESITLDLSEKGNLNKTKNLNTFTVNDKPRKLAFHIDCYLSDISIKDFTEDEKKALHRFFGTTWPYELWEDNQTPPSFYLTMGGNFQLGEIPIAAKQTVFEAAKEKLRDELMSRLRDLVKEVRERKLKHHPLWAGGFR